MTGPKADIQLFDKILFTQIFKTFRIAIHPSQMIIAFLAMALIGLCGILLDFSNSVVASSDKDINELHIYMQNPSTLGDFIEFNKDNGKRTGVYSTMWRHSARQFQSAVNNVLDGRFLATSDNVANCFKAAGWAFRYHFVYSVIFAAVKLVIICIAGGAICRISALQFARGEKPGISEALRFSTKKFISFLAAPMAPIAISICLVFIIFLIGLIGNIPYAGEIIVAVLTFLALAIGILITIVLIGTVAGFNLMFPALAYDGLDCFDAISRSFNYVYSRPWRMIFYTILAAIYGAICYMFVRFFAFLLFLTTRFSLALGLFGKSEDKFDVIWPQPSFENLTRTAFEATSGWTEWLAASIIHIFVLIVLGLIVAFIVSFYFSANTIIYALLRNKVDNTPIDEICEDSMLPEPAVPDEQSDIETNEKELNESEQ